MRGERRSLRTSLPACLSAHRPSLSIPTHLDAFQLLQLTPFDSTPTFASYGTNDPQAARDKATLARAKDKALEERKARQLAAARHLAAKRRMAEGKPAEMMSDPGRLTRATHSHASRVATEREDSGLFDARPAVMYLQQRATPTWLVR